MNQLPTPHLPRFRVLEVLGAGGMGEVYRVFDRDREEVVALKRILAPAPAALVRFKHEFRAVEQLDHPGLVRLFELGEDQAGLFFTMEYVAGVDLRHYASATTHPSGSGSSQRDRSSTTLETTSANSREARSCINSVHARPSVRTAEPPTLRIRDLAPLSSSLPQLVEAVAYLHRRGLVHRDLKPSNILVTEEGRVKLLDFGVLAEMGRAGHGIAAGTPGYMAPEQIRGEEARPANDLFALGVLLYELASGSCPFDGGTSQEVMNRTLAVDPVPLSTVAPWVPQPLSDLCSALLRKSPEERATLEFVAEALPGALGARHATVVGRLSVAPLVGRETEKSELRTALAPHDGAGPTVIVLEGPSGVGKSALARWFLEEGRRRGRMALESRARPNDSVPFGGLDELIDKLAEGLHGRKIDRDGTDDRVAAMREAGALFPVLLPRGESIPETVVRGRGPAIDALARLLAREADDAGGLALVLDDFQWATGDAVAVVSRLLERGGGNWVVVATVRSDLAETAATSMLSQLPFATRLRLPPLAREDAEKVMDQTLEGCAVWPSESERGAILRLAEGRPFLLELAARHWTRIVSAGLPRTVEPWAHAVQSLLDACTEKEKLILSLSVAENGWLSESELGEIVGCSRGETEDAVRALRARGLVRSDGLRAKGRRVDIYHDGIRQGLLARFANEVHAAHSALADKQISRGEIGGKTVFHLEDAGRHAEACGFAPAAAEQAMSQGAFLLAAKLYELALTGASGDRRLRAARAEALEAAGLYRDAAGLWEQLAVSEDRDERRDALLTQAKCLLAATELRLGRACVDKAIEEGLLPRMGKLQMLLLTLQFLIGPLGIVHPKQLPRDAATAPAPDEAFLLRAQSTTRGIMNAAQMIAYFDPLGGLAYVVHARNSCGAHGWEEAGECSLRLAYFAEFMATDRQPSGRSRRYVREAMPTLTRLPTHENVGQTGARFVTAIECKRRGDWDEATTRLEEVISESARAGRGASFEHLLYVAHRAQVAVFRDDPKDLAAQFSLFRDAADSSEAFAIVCHLRLIECFLLYLRGEIEEGVRAASEAVRMWPSEEPSFQRFLVEFGAAIPAVLDSSRSSARHRLLRSFRAHHRFRVTTNMYGGVFRSFLALHEAAALRAGEKDASARTVRRLTRGLESAPPFWTVAGLRARAYAEDATGHPERAVAVLRHAHACAERWKQPLQKAVTAYQLGRRLAGDEGAKLVTEARETVRRRGSHERLLEEDPGLK